MNEKLSKLMKKEEKEFKQFLFDTVFAPHLKTSPLKSLEASSAEAMQQVDKLMEFFKTDVKKGFELFEQKVLPFERKRLFIIANKLESTVSILVENSASIPQEIEIADLEFLEEIAKRVYTAKNYPEASCMFRFIIQLNPVYSPAWIYWAMCETIQNHHEIVDQIYDMGLQFLSEDYLIRIYASEYYIKTNRQEKAREILLAAKDSLINEGMQASYTYSKVNNLINILR